MLSALSILAGDGLCVVHADSLLNVDVSNKSPYYLLTLAQIEDAMKDLHDKVTSALPGVESNRRGRPRIYQTEEERLAARRKQVSASMDVYRAKKSALDKARAELVDVVKWACAELSAVRQENVMKLGLDIAQDIKTIQSKLEWALRSAEDARAAIPAPGRPEDKPSAAVLARVIPYSMIRGCYVCPKNEMLTWKGRGRAPAWVTEMQAQGWELGVVGGGR